MRLFIAVPLSDRARDQILSLSDSIRATCGGNFTSRENLHITLEFLGELSSDRLPSLRAAMAAVSCPPVALTLGERIGHFGDLWWLSIQSPALEKLQSALHRELKARGFSLESQPFRPHLTLVRRLTGALPFAPEKFSEHFSPFTETAREMVLYESSRLNGRLTYTPLDVRRLGAD